MQTAGAGASASELLDATQSIPIWRLFEMKVISGLQDDNAMIFKYL
jgi:hypothetical protein